MLSAQSTTDVSFQFSWKNPLDRRYFVLLAWLLHIRDKQQESQKPSSTTIASAPDDSDDDCESDTATYRPKELTHTARLTDLKRRFLNRLAEVMARVKNSNTKKSKRCTRKKGSPPSSTLDTSNGAVHVAATILLDNSHKPIIYVAKNGGLDAEDNDLIQTLGKWVRVLAQSGQRPSIATDKVWPKLVKYYAPRLNVYIEEFRTAYKGLEHPTSDACGFWQKLSALDRMCSQLGRPSTGDEMPANVSEAISLAYELRSTSNFLDYMQSLPSRANAQAVWKATCYLGRLRGAYETFKEAAMHFGSFRHLELLAVEPPQPETVSIELSFITNALSDLGLTAQGLGVRTQALKALCQQPMHTHAEMQLLLQTKQQTSTAEHLNVFPYIGTSKKTCFLCARVLVSIRDFQTRGSHGKIYPLWTVPECSSLEPRFGLKLGSAILSTQKLMVDRIKLKKEKSLQHVAESSVGISSLSSGPSLPQRLRHNAKLQQRLKNAESEVPVPPRSPISLLGDQLSELQAIRIPAGRGEMPTLITLAMCETSKGYDCVDRHCFIVPQFEEYWSQCQYDRGMVPFEDQVRDVMNGSFHLYWNTNSELGQNEYLKASTVGPGASIESDRRFFYGDVFILGISKNEDGNDWDSKGNTTYRDLSQELLDSPLINTMISHMWDTHALEEHVKLDEEQRRQEEDCQRSREIALAEM